MQTEPSNSSSKGKKNNGCNFLFFTFMPSNEQENLHFILTSVVFLPGPKPGYTLVVCNLHVVSFENKTLLACGSAQATEIQTLFSSLWAMIISLTKNDSSYI